MAPAFVGKPPHLRIKSSEQPTLARFFAPRLFEAFCLKAFRHAALPSPQSQYRISLV
jgi:hypothetical protein